MGDIEFRQFNKGIVDLTVCHHAAGLVVTLKRLGNKLLASSENVERIAKHIRLGQQDLPVQ
jgi:hypothetical protein